MPWWNTVFNTLHQGQILQTPGRGLDGGGRQRDFLIYQIQSNKIFIISGSTRVLLTDECFNSIENYFIQYPLGFLRIASLHDNKAFDNSADQIIREATGSSLARGNYVCAILVYCELVHYSMQRGRKIIVLA
jgi:hypothetical protein